MTPRTSCHRTSAARRAGASRARARTHVPTQAPEARGAGLAAVGRLQRAVGNSGMHRLLRGGTIHSARTQTKAACPDCEEEVATTAAAVPATAPGATTTASGPVCQVAPPPGDLACTEATSSVGSGTNIMFGQDSPSISAADRATLSAIAAAWHTGGGVAFLRVDGFASCDGPVTHNWRLSCSRAQAVAAELAAPSDGSPGVPTSHLEVLANGETSQFDGRLLGPNRRVVVSGGGPPPPGPPCHLAITGPTEVDHYCAAYVPSDAITCGVFPAPNITLNVSGAPATAALRWSVTRGASNASIVGSVTGTSVAIRGDAASSTQGDVTIQVTDGTCTTTQSITVREPTSMTDAQAPTVAPTFVRTVVTYTVRDQFGNPMGANICVDETMTLCGTSHPGAMAFGDAGTNAAGQVVDTLGAGPPIASGFCRKFDQVFTAGGCPVQHNTIVLRNSGVTLTHGAACAPGSGCP